MGFLSSIGISWSQGAWRLFDCGDIQRWSGRPFVPTRTSTVATAAATTATATITATTRSATGKRASTGKATRRIKLCHPLLLSWFPQVGDHPPSPALQLYIYTFGKFIHAYFLLKLCLYLYINICIHFLIYQHISLFIHTRPLFFFSSLSPFLCRLSGCGHFPVLTMGERALSVLGCSYADDVLHDAPYVITSDMIAALHIDIVAEVPSLTQSYGFPITTSPVSSISDGAISDGGTGAAHFLRKLQVFWNQVVKGCFLVGWSNRRKGIKGWSNRRNFGSS